MSQPTSTAFADDTPPTTADTCPDGVAFCIGECPTWNDDEGTTYHASAFQMLTVDSHNRLDVDLTVSTTRLDVNNTTGQTQIHMLTGQMGDDFTFTPSDARKFAAMFLNAADNADPVPAGVFVIAASAVRLGDEVLTDDGWQKVTGQMVFVDQVNVWTDGVDRDPDTEGWEFGPADPVKVRRAVHPGAEPTLTRASVPEESATGWCARCRADRLITGKRIVSARGVIRVRGRCGDCNKDKQSAFVGLTGWAEDAR